MELLSRLGVVEEDLRGLELRTILVPVLAHQVNKLLRSKGINHAEGAAAEWREANAKHGSNVYGNMGHYIS